MAATPPGARKRKLEYNIDQQVFDDFHRLCSHQGFAPQVEIERLMKKYIQAQGKM